MKRSESFPAIISSPRRENFPPGCRLCRTEDFNAVFKKGRHVSRDLFRVHVRFSPALFLKKRTLSSAEPGNNRAGPGRSTPQEKSHPSPPQGTSPSPRPTPTPSPGLRPPSPQMGEGRGEGEVFSHGRPGEGEVFSYERPSRLGVVASRKTGGAVRRNRFKRLIREAFRKMRRELPAVDLVVVAKDSWKRKTSAWNQTQANGALRDALRQLGVKI